MQITKQLALFLDNRPGMLARLGFAVATDSLPDILVVDEILSVGDERFRAKSEERMEQLRSSGATVIFVSHSLESVQRLCHRAALLERGRLVAVGAVDHVIQLYHDRRETSSEASSTMMT